MPEPDRDALDQVRAHLDDAHAAADRLVREAQRQAEDAARAAAAEDVPPRGWDTAPGSAEQRPLLADLQAIIGLIDSVRRSIPPDLTRQLAEALRDLLLALRALIDWYLERLGGSADRDDRPVEDIPLD